MNPDAYYIHEVAVDAVAPLRTAVLRPQFDAGELLHYPGDHHDRAHHYAAIAADGDDSSIVAVVSYLGEAIPIDDQSATCRLRGMAVAPALQRQGLGSHLLSTTLTRMALHRPGQQVWAAARVGVTDFYVGHGFEPVGPPFEMPSVGPHQRMIRALPTALASTKPKP